MIENILKFHTDYKYTDRETKAKFVYEKYKSILKGKILDVGADQCSLKKYFSKDIKYVGVGLGESPDLISVDLEKEKIPYLESSFDCVLCLDVLEHLENIHEVFDDLCKITQKWLIISLPNPWAVFMGCLQNSRYKEDRNIKFYGLTKEKDEDRHKWFFSSSEAKEFVKYRANKNNMHLYDLYVENGGNDGLIHPVNWWKKRELKKLIKARNLLFRRDFHFTDVYEGTQWYVLRKK